MERNNRCNKRKRCFLFVAISIFVLSFAGEIYAQSNFSNYNFISLQTNFLSKSKDFNDYLSSKGVKVPNAFMPSVSVSYSFYRGYKNMFLWGVVATFSYGMYDYKDNFRKKEDMLCYAEGIYRLPAGNFCSFDFGVGFGLAYINAFHAQNNNQIGSFSSAVPILPITVSMVFSPKAKSNSIALYVQYIVPFKGNDVLILQGTDTEFQNFHLEPSTLSLGVKYGF